MSVKYKNIADKLEEEISKGIYDETKKIPTEEEICQRFDVSRSTTRKAVEVLVKKGCVYQIQGSGVFVRDKLEGNCINLQNMNGVTKDFAGKKVKTKVIEFKLLEANEELAEKMQCNIGTPVYFVNRIRVIDGENYAIEYSYFNKNLILYLNDEIIKGSIYNYIKEDLKLTIGIIDRFIYADYISDRDGEYLGIEKGSPALINENKAKLLNGEIFDYSISILNYKNAKFTFMSNLK